MLLNDYLAAAQERLSAAGFVAAPAAAAPPQVQPVTAALLGRAGDDGTDMIALLTAQGMDAAGCAACAGSWYAWLREQAGAVQSLTLLFGFAGSLNAGIQEALRQAVQPGLIIGVVDIDSHFAAAFATDTAGAALPLLPGFGEARHEPKRRIRRGGDEAPSTPWMTYSLMAVCIGIWLVITAATGSLDATSNPEVMVRWGSNYGLLTWADQYWRLFTSIWLHFGLIHLAVNMYSLYVVGPQVEFLFGRWRLLVIWVLAGVTGSVVSLLLAPPTINSAGASGALWGLLGTFVYFKLFAPQGRLLRWMPLLTVIGVNAAISFMPGIDWRAHFGGFAGGFVAALLVGLPGRLPWRGVPAALALVLAAAVCTGVLPLGPAGTGAYVRGVRLADGGEWPQAADAFRQAVAANPRVARYHVGLAEAYLQLNDRTQATREAQEAMRLEPQTYRQGP